MSLAELSDMVRSGEMSHREANELDGMEDDRMYCSICQELFDEEELSNCDLCGCELCDDCKVVIDDCVYCDECKELEDDS